jgi:hypothetical protein
MNLRRFPSSRRIARRRLPMRYAGRLRAQSSGAGMVVGEIPSRRVQGHETPAPDAFSGTWRRL